MKLSEGLGVAGGNCFEADFADAIESNGVGRGIRKIDDAILWDGSAIVDADEHTSAVAQVGDADPASEREGAVRAGEGIHIEVFAGRGAMSLKLETIPGCLADLQPMAET